MSPGNGEMIDLTPDWIYLHSAPSSARIEIPLCPGQDRITTARLIDRTSRLAGGLDDLGVSRGDRIATLVRSPVPLLEILLACARIGAVLVPLDSGLSEMDLSMATADSIPSVLLYERLFVAGAWAAASGADCMLVSVDTRGTINSQYDALLGAEPVGPAPVSADHPWVIQYQSRPGPTLEKTVLTHGAILRDSISAALAWTSPGRGRPRDPAPLIHAGRFNVCLLAWLLYGTNDTLSTASGEPTSERAAPPPPCSGPAVSGGCSSCSVLLSSR